jgi:hypothetical protein
LEMVEAAWRDLMLLVAEPILGEDEKGGCPTSLIRVGSRWPTEFAISRERSRRST